MACKRPELGGPSRWLHLHERFLEGPLHPGGEPPLAGLLPGEGACDEPLRQGGGRPERGGGRGSPRAQEARGQERSRCDCGGREGASPDRAQRPNLRDRALVSDHNDRRSGGGGQKSRGGSRLPGGPILLRDPLPDQSRKPPDPGGGDGLQLRHLRQCGRPSCRPDRAGLRIRPECDDPALQGGLPRIRRSDRP